MADLIVYTATDGRKLAPNRKWRGVRMICFSREPAPDPWEWQPMDIISDDPCRNAKLPKILPWRVLPPWSQCLWIDANLELKRDPVELMRRFRGIAIHTHRARKCIFEEAQACIRLKKDDRRKILEYLVRNSDHPLDYGLWECGMIIRENRLDLRWLCEDWWAEIETGSRRDQLSFPVVSRRHGIKPVSLGTNIRASRMIAFR